MAAAKNVRTIHAPELMSRRLRARDTVFTTLMWGVYAYLWLPIISLGAWLMGIDFAYEVMVRAGGADGLTRILAWYGLAAVVIIALVTGWSATQRIRFRGNNRRGLVPVVETAALQASSGLPAEAFTALRRERRVCVQADADGVLLSAVPPDRSAAA
jgi:biofilm PGA synthesis protein PgaD